MSKTVKGMVMRDYASRLDGTQDGMLISIRGVSAIQTNKLRGQLRKKNIRVTVMRNALARRTFEGTGLAGLAPLLEGPNALAYGSDSVVEVAREIVRLIADFPGVELRGAVLDGQLFTGDAGVKELSKYPTKDEAIGRAVTLIVSPGRKLVGQILGPGRRVMGLVKAVEEKLEKGEAIARA